MPKAILLAAAAFTTLLSCSEAIAACATTHPLTNGTTADATDVMGNFSDLTNCAAPLSSPAFTGFPSYSGSYFTFGDYATYRGSILLTAGTAGGSNFYVNNDYVSGSSFLGVKPAGGPYALAIGNGGAVGIGTTSPTAPLDINTASGDATIKLIANGGAAYGSYTIARNDPLSGTGYVNYMDGYGSNETSWGANSLVGMRLYSGGNAVLVLYNSSSASTVRLSSSGVSYFNGGDVGIGTSTPAYNFFVNGTAGGPSGFTNTSDLRLKKDIRPIIGALSLVGGLQGVRFRWKTAKERTIDKEMNLPATPQVGFIAQSVITVLPEAVTIGDDPDATLGVKESKIIPVLVEAVKELKAINERQARALARLTAAKDSQAVLLNRLRIDVVSLQREVRMKTAQD